MYYLLCFLLGLLLSLVLGFYLSTVQGISFLVNFQGLNNSLSLEDQELLSKLLTIMGAGAFGGLLYSLQNRKLELPYISDNRPTDTNRSAATSGTNSSRNNGKVINLGGVADCLVGIGGALVVFLILPGEETDPIKRLATAMIGGYGGRGLLDQAVDSLAKKQQELQEKVDRSIEELDKTKDEIDADKVQADRDAKTLKLLSRHLDKSLMLAPEAEKELLDNIKLASSVTRTSIFKETQSALYQNRYAAAGSPDEMVVKNALKVFEALRDSDKDGSNDRYPAHIAYALMTLKQWDRAIAELENAKKALSKVGSAGGTKQNEVVYECNQVICKLKSGAFSPSETLDFLGTLKRDLAKLDPPLSLKDVQQLLSSSDNPIMDWLEQNNINPDTLTPNPVVTSPPDPAAPSTDSALSTSTSDPAIPNPDPALSTPDPAPPNPDPTLSTPDPAPPNPEPAPSTPDPTPLSSDSTGSTSSPDPTTLNSAPDSPTPENESTP